jgi:hypothetical protein
VEDLKAETDDMKLRRYKSNFLIGVTRINNKMPKIMLNCRPNERGRLESPL